MIDDQKQHAFCEKELELIRKQVQPYNQAVTKSKETKRS
jgi:hypothetical protein